MAAVEDMDLKRVRATRRSSISSQLDSLRAWVESLATQERYFGQAVPIAQELKSTSKVSTEDVSGGGSFWIQAYTLSVKALGNL